jgi:RNA polymerase sigma factor (sigma-70 family)
VTEQVRESVRRAVAGDKVALGSLLEQFGPDVEVHLTISPLWRGQLDAADVMQVTYLEAFLQIDRFDAARADAFPAWLQRMAENNLRDAIRSLESGRNPPPRKQLEAYGGDTSLALFDALTAGIDTPSRAARQDEAGQRLRQAVGCMPPDYAKAVELYDLQELPVDDVAAAMGRSPGAVFMLRARAHERLRELLGGAAHLLESRA